MASLLFLFLLFPYGLDDQADDPSEKAYASWDFSFSLRAWSADLGLVELPGKGIAPIAEFDAVRDKFLFRVTYQFPTLFRGVYTVDTYRFDGQAERTDLDVSGGWRLDHHKFGRKYGILYRAQAGVKSLVIKQDDLSTTDVIDDFQTRWRGPFLGFTGLIWGTWAKTWDWDLKWTVDYAYLDVRSIEKPAARSSTTDPFSYSSDGVFLDLSFNIYLFHRNIQGVIGYRRQGYFPHREYVKHVRRVNPTRDGVVVFYINPATRKFEADGWLAGFSFKF